MSLEMSHADKFKFVTIYSLGFECADLWLCIFNMEVEEEAHSMPLCDTVGELGGSSSIFCSSFFFSLPDIQTSDSRLKH